MNTPATSSRTAPSWQHELARAVRDPAELWRLLDLPLDLLPAAHRAAQLFPLRVPHAFIARMQRGNVHDPLLRQVLPLDAERDATPGFNTDPVGDLAAMKTPGLLHKYHGRVLLVTTGACAVHCRYCFRRHFPYTDANPAVEQWQAALDHIAADASINEVILSGGDPLALTDIRLAALVEQLDAIPHLQRLRIHSRVPVVLPQRVDAALIRWLSATRLQTVIVLHVNHAHELDDAVRAAISRLAAANATLLNQSVLLRGINDDVDVLRDLSNALFGERVLPYYLHQLDRVQGAAHFEVDDARARELVRELSARLPGYLVPRLVREDAAAPNKTPLDLRLEHFPVISSI